MEKDAQFLSRRTDDCRAENLFLNKKQHSFKDAAEDITFMSILTILHSLI